MAGRRMVKNKHKDFSIINKKLTIEGTVSANQGLIIKGTVKGTLVGKDVIIAEQGSVYADARVESATISGVFEGQIKASEALIILSTGSCKGKIVCKDFSVESGGILNAHVTCGAAGESVLKKDLPSSKKSK
jgi:cytoskeletal protein CcmA (bactofilin family)